MPFPLRRAGVAAAVGVGGRIATFEKGYGILVVETERVSDLVAACNERNMASAKRGLDDEWNQDGTTVAE